MLHLRSHASEISHADEVETLIFVVVRLLQLLLINKLLTFFESSQYSLTLKGKYQLMEGAECL